MHDSPSIQFLARGFLVLERKTPVIDAIFGHYRLEPAAWRSDGKLLLAITDTQSVTRHNVRDSLLALVNSWPQEELTDETIVAMFEQRFGSRTDAGFTWLANGDGGDEIVSPSQAFQMARWLDDGHGLETLELEGFRQEVGDQARVGGHGEFLSKHCAVHFDSADAVMLGNLLELALKRQDCAGGADLIIKHLKSIICGLALPEHRRAVQIRLCELLSTSSGLPAPGGDSHQALIRCGE